MKYMQRKMSFSSNASSTCMASLQNLTEVTDLPFWLQRCNTASSMSSIQEEVGSDDNDGAFLVRRAATFCPGYRPYELKAQRRARKNLCRTTMSKAALLNYNVICAAVRVAVAYRAKHGELARRNIIVCDTEVGKRDDVCYLMFDRESDTEGSRLNLPITSTEGMEAFLRETDVEYLGETVGTVIDSVSGKPSEDFICKMPPSVWDPSTTRKWENGSVSSDASLSFFSRHSSLGSSASSLRVLMRPAEPKYSQILKGQDDRFAGPQFVSNFAPFPIQTSRSRRSYYRGEPQTPQSFVSRPASIDSAGAQAYALQRDQACAVADRIPCLILVIFGNNPIEVITAIGNGGANKVETQSSVWM